MSTSRSTKRKASPSDSHKTIIFHKELYRCDEDGSVFFKVKNEREKYQLVRQLNKRWESIPKSKEEVNAFSYVDGYDEKDHIQFLFLCATGCELDTVPLQQRIDGNKKLQEKPVWQTFTHPSSKRSKNTLAPPTSPLQAGSIFSTKNNSAAEALPINDAEPDESDLATSQDWEQFINALPDRPAPKSPTNGFKK